MKEFHEHLDGCDQCRNNPFALCADGDRLLRKAAINAEAQLGRPVDRSYFREAGEPAPDQPQGNEFFVIGEQGVGVGKFAGNGNDIELRPRSSHFWPWPEIMQEMLDAADKSFTEFAARVSGVRAGPIEGEKAWVLFEFDGKPLRMPEPYPEVIWGSEETDTVKRMCVIAILSGKAEVL